MQTKLTSSHPRFSWNTLPFSKVLKYSGYRLFWLTRRYITIICLHLLNHLLNIKYGHSWLGTGLRLTVEFLLICRVLWIIWVKCRRRSGCGCGSAQPPGEKRLILWRTCLPHHLTTLGNVFELLRWKWVLLGYLCGSQQRPVNLSLSECINAWERLCHVYMYMGV